jgi:hypothetical protein
LGLFDDKRPTLHQPAAEFFNGLLGAIIGFCLDESKAARPLGFPIERNAHAADHDILG